MTADDLSGPHPATAKTTAADLVAGGARGVIGCIPFVGPLAAEIIGAIIPGQRADRIHDLLLRIAARAEQLDQDVFAARMKSPEGVDLMEDGFLQVARAMTTASAAD